MPKPQHKSKRNARGSEHESVVEDLIADYDRDKLTIATICSHSALQIFHGARQEGFRTLGIARGEAAEFYDAFPYAKPDSYIALNDYHDILTPRIQAKLRKANAIIVPHGSFVEYVGADNIQKQLHIPLFGNKTALQWEANRGKLRDWIERSGLKAPKEYTSTNQIEGLAIAKLSGAKGGRGYQLVTKGMKLKKEYSIQEYVIGVRYYPHFFYSLLSKTGLKAGKGTLELLSMDKRIESNIDELYRMGLTQKELREYGVTPSFVVTGNAPVVVREALLVKLMKMGRSIIESSIELFYPGIVGPFCIETICTPELEFIIFEISSRIVAGTNLYPAGSPYTPYSYDEPMSTGRRIAREIRMAAEEDLLAKVLS